MSFEARISLKNHIIAAFMPSPTTPTAANAANSARRFLSLNFEYPKRTQNIIHQKSCHERDSRGNDGVEAAKLHKRGHNAVIHHKGKAAHKDVSEKLYECIIGITRKSCFIFIFMFRSEKFLVGNTAKSESTIYKYVLKRQNVAIFYKILSFAQIYDAVFVHGA